MSVGVSVRVRIRFRVRVRVRFGVRVRVKPPLTIITFYQLKYMSERKYLLTWSLTLHTLTLTLTL